MKQHIVQIGSIIVISLIVLAYILFSRTTSTSTMSNRFNTTTAQQVSAPTGSNPSTTKTYTLADVSSHNSESSCWMVINGSVYDVTSYIPQHNSQILRGCGQDATAMYTGERKHQRQNNQLLPEFQIGVLAK